MNYSSDTGYFRLRKAGNTGFTDYWDGANWVNVFSEARLQSSSKDIKMYTLSSVNNPTVNVDVDYFQTTAGIYSTSGTLTLKYDSAASGAKWSKLLHTSTQPVGTSIKFRTRTAETEAGLANAIWSDYLTSSGSGITSPAARWIEVESTLATTDTNATPLLHDVSVTFESNPGETIWQTDVPTSLVQNAVTELNKTIGTLGMTGKFYLEGTLTSSTGQTVASAVYPFYVEQGNIQMTLSPDKKIYHPGETVTIGGEVKNLSSIAVTGLTARVQGTGVATPYTETFDLPANSAHPFGFTTTAGGNCTYKLTGSVTQNSAPLADVADQYEVAIPALTATLTAPDTVANVPFTVSVTVTNSGKVDATTSIHVVDDSGTVVGDQSVTLPAGESRILQYTRQIVGSTTYTAVMSGDLSQTLTTKVAYSVLATDTSVSGKIVTDKVSYNPNEPVTLTTTISAASSRENLSALITVANSQGQAVYSATTAIPTLIQGQIITSRNYWETNSNPAGAYSVTLQVFNGATVISSATSGFSIIASTATGGSLVGTVAAQPNVVETGNNATLAYTITNQGNQDLASFAMNLLVVDPATSELLKTIDAGSGLSLTMNGSKSGNVSFNTTGIAPKTLLTILQYSLQGTVKSLASAPFTVTDTTAPLLTVSTLANGSYTKNEILNVTGTVADNIGIKDLQVNGVSVPVLADNTFSQAVLLKSGPNTLSVVATDLANNQSSDNRIINLDQTAPQLVITSPVDNSKTNLALLDVTGSVDDATCTVVATLNGIVQPVIRNGNGFTSNVTLVPNLNTIEVTATDLVNNTSSQKRTVIYDDQKPSLAITEPAQDIRTNQPGLTIKGTVIDPYTLVEVSVAMDGNLFTPSVLNGQFQQPLSFTEEKSYAIVVTATNEAGSSTTTQRNVMYDVTAPALTINPVTSPTTVDSQIVSGTRESGLDVIATSSTATIGEITYPSATTWQVSVTGLKPGSNVITVSATDAANNVATASKEIVYTVATSTGAFSAAVFGNSKVTMTGGSYADSYINSPSSWVKGKYKNGDVGTNSLQSCGIQMSGGVQVFGKAWVGYGGNPVTGKCVTGGSSITGGAGVLALAKEMAPKTDPGGGIALGVLKLTGGVSRTLTSGEYRVTSINLSGGTTLNLNGPITIHNDGNFTIAGGAKVVITAGPVIVYQNGKTINISNGVIVNNSQTPKNFTIYGTSGLQTINLTGGTNVHALIYAPNAAIKISGGQNTFGSVIGNTVDISGGSSVHYDESLKN